MHPKVCSDTETSAADATHTIQKANPPMATPRKMKCRLALISSFSSADFLDRRDQFLRRENSPGIVGRVDLERGFHFVPAVAPDGIVHQPDFVAQLRSIANGRVDAGIRAYADHDQLVNAVLLELQIEIGVGEPAGAPVLLRNDLPRLRRELVAKASSPGSVGEDLRPR